MLLTSPYRPVEYQVGDFDLENLTFAATTKGVLDAGHTLTENSPYRTTAHYYATNIINAPDGRVILLGWIRGFPAGHGWNGCLALPRVLTIGADRRPRQNPVAELEKLRGRCLTFPARTLPPTPTIIATAAEASLEIDRRLRPLLGQSVALALSLRASNSAEPSLTITYDGATLTMADTSLPFTLNAGEPLRLRLFIDRSAIELYVNDGATVITLAQPMPTTSLDIEIAPQGNTIDLLSFTAWELIPL